MITDGDASSDGVVAVKETPVMQMSLAENSAYETYIEGILR